MTPEISLEQENLKRGMVRLKISVLGIPQLEHHMQERGGERATKSSPIQKSFVIHPEDVARSKNAQHLAKHWADQYNATLNFWVNGEPADSLDF